MESLYPLLVLLMYFELDAILWNIKLSKELESFDELEEAEDDN
jgi:hypothetical protein